MAAFSGWHARERKDGGVDNFERVGKFLLIGHAEAMESAGAWSLSTRGVTIPGQELISE